MILITGANGFIGSALVYDLNRRGRTDLILNDAVSRNERKEPLQAAKYSDFVHATDLDVFLKSKPAKFITHIFHMGAISTTTETSWDKLVKNNIQLSQTLFHFAAKNNVTLIYASSGAVYGSGEHGFDDQKHPEVYQPLNLYGRSKRDFDIWALAQAAKPKNWYGLRFFNVYGPNEYHKQEMTSVVYKAFHQIQNTSKLKLFRSHNTQYKDGEQLRDFVYVKDITRWMIEIAENENFQSGIYNQGYGTARTWIDLAQEIFKSLKKQPRIDWIDIPENIRNQYQYFTQANMKQAFTAGLSKPEYDISDGVKDYLANYLLKSNPWITS